MSRARRGLAGVALLLAGAAAAAPYRPDDDARILLKLPAGVAARAAPNGDPEAAARQARAYIERSRRDSDPRFLGYAQGVLGPWWKDSAPPDAVLLLRATILQSQHRFDEALADLALLLKRDPRDGQAWLTRATILRVQGRPREALEACAKLRGLAPDFYAAVCEAAARGLGGEPRAAAAALDAVAANAPDPSARAWWLAERADLAQQLGDTDGALALYALAAREGVADPQLLAAQAQLLLDRGRAAEALAVVGSSPQADLLRLRRAQALRALGTPDPALEAALAEGYAAARRRGESSHLREEARFELSVRGDAARALELAVENWRTQREADDARLLREAEAAAR